ncbi:MAG: hypothetical protein WC137_02280 [Alphaproteobacteria bacterium]
MKKYKKIIYVLIGLALAFWIGFRINSIYQESKRQVFNSARRAALPVETMIAHRQTNFLREPVFVKNNRAFIASSRINKFRAGQSIGNGRIISVANQLDLDTGMYLVKTSGVRDGDNFTLQTYTGFFIPEYAVNDGKVMVSENGMATIKDVEIIDSDADNILIKSGINDGDIIILSRVESGTMVKTND